MQPQVEIIKATATDISDTEDTLIGTIRVEDQDYLKLIFKITMNDTSDFMIIVKTTSVLNGDIEEGQILIPATGGTSCYADRQIFNRDVPVASLPYHLLQVAFDAYVYIRAGSNNQGTPGTLDWLKAVKRQVYR